MKKILVLMLIGLSAPSHSAIIYVSQGFDNGLTCDPCFGPSSDVNSDSQASEAAERVVLDSNYRIDGLSWTGSPYPPIRPVGLPGFPEFQWAPTTFIISFYNETVAGLPALSAFATFNIGANYNSFETLFSADISGVDLIAEVPYHVTIQESTWVDEPGTWRWYGEVGAVYLRTGDSTSGVANRPWRIAGDGEIASRGLALEGKKTTVPEPATLGLMALGVIGVLVRRRTRSLRPSVE